MARKIMGRLFRDYQLGAGLPSPKPSSDTIAATIVSRRGLVRGLMVGAVK
jgi:hypothetical protein